jgi:hypothetical protein
MPVLFRSITSVLGVIGFCCLLRLHQSPLFSPTTFFLLGFVFFLSSFLFRLYSNYLMALLGKFFFFCCYFSIVLIGSLILAYGRVYLHAALSAFFVELYSFLGVGVLIIGPGEMVVTGMMPAEGNPPAAANPPAANQQHVPAQAAEEGQGEAERQPAEALIEQTRGQLRLFLNFFRRNACSERFLNAQCDELNLTRASPQKLQKIQAEMMAICQDLPNLPTSGQNAAARLLMRIEAWEQGGQA